MKTSSLFPTMAILVAVTSNLLISGCGREGGGGSCEEPPNVEGVYLMADSNCPGFAPEIEVVQNDCNVLLRSTSAGYLDADGSIDDRGDFEVSNENGKCEGDFFGNSGSATCTHKETGNKCQISYVKRTAPTTGGDCEDACSHLYDDCGFALFDNRGYQLTERECVDGCNSIVDENPREVSCLARAECSEEGISDCFEDKTRTEDEASAYEAPETTGGDSWREGAREYARGGDDPSRLDPPTTFDGYDGGAY